jgi:hypothetical protein
MNRLLLFLITGLILNLNAAANFPTERKLNDSVNDGPYIFNVKNKLNVKSIKNNLLVVENITTENFNEIRARYNLNCSFKDLSVNHLKKISFSQSFNGVDSIGVISDIHGNYKTYINLLKVSGIVDKDLNWKFGKGHLVILGDIFDRGDMVTEILWHLYGLEKQAAEAGGMVHVMLGNHEVMVLDGDLTYMNQKYKQVEKISGTKYSDLYAGNSVLGNWLRSKPIMITINDIIFVHAGISPELVQRKLTASKVNQQFSDKIVGKELKSKDVSSEEMLQAQINDPMKKKADQTDTVLIHNVPRNTGLTANELAANIEYEELMFLVQNDGPIWYRGFFDNSDFNESTLDSILGFFNKNHIVVGHTTSKDIKSLFNNKIIGVDAGIGSGQPGEMLIYKNGSFYRCYITGSRIKF